jgi:acetyl-CoA carboxylase carboxyltransferase component
MARHEALQAYYAGFAQPFRAAEHFGIEDIIDPRDTRPLLCRWVALAFDGERLHLGPKSRGMRC